MNFKKSKQQVVDDATMRAESVIYNHLSQLKYNYGNASGNSVLDTIQIAMISGIREAVREIVESTYTDEEFESDIGLKS